MGEDTWLSYVGYGIAISAYFVGGWLGAVLIVVATVIVFHSKDRWKD